MRSRDTGCPLVRFRIHGLSDRKSRMTKWNSTRTIFTAAPLLVVGAFSLTVFAADESPPAAKQAVIKHQVTGLFSKDRESDLREVFETLPQFKLVSIDFEAAEIGLEYDPTKVFPNAKPEQVIERFDSLLRNASHHTFGIKPLRTVEKEKLKRIEVRVAGLDCKACGLGAYEAVYRLKGVESATASFKEGLVAAWVHPEQIDQVEIETALKQRGVQIVAP